MEALPYQNLSSYFRRQFGERVHKITIDAGFTCPNRDGTLSTGGCMYCNARGSGNGAHQAGLSIRQQIEDGKARLSRRFKANLFMAYFQAFTNTYAPIPVLKACYDEALCVDGVAGLSIGTRPDCVSPEIIDLLASYAKDRLIWVEYGLQSANDTTLFRINRGHDVACFERAVVATQNRGIKICAHVILGLPGETRKDMLRTADRIADMGLDGVKLHLLYVVRETPLEVLYRDGGFRCLEQDEYADIVCAFIERLPPAMIIHRLTGDPHPHELAAPMWALEKQKTLSMIHDCFSRRKTWQGKKWKG
ncbi:TIGR01212 family radical SAM protein [Desulfosarcina sp. OttesenSCG-928-G10]|nr:TIGR01212 family radical SAM protein [Desulfosarcina sp. OttesenSCG-928-G10]MDL2322235.1 TIGR01212 family radical SAM protein [Desulfosarcina sp. OttesenSCG-928-B08]